MKGILTGEADIPFNPGDSQLILKRESLLRRRLDINSFSEVSSQVPPDFYLLSQAASEQ